MTACCTRTIRREHFYRVVYLLIYLFIYQCFGYDQKRRMFQGSSVSLSRTAVHSFWCKHLFVFYLPCSSYLFCQRQVAKAKETGYHATQQLRRALTRCCPRGAGVLLLLFFWREAVNTEIRPKVSRQYEHWFRQIKTKAGLKGGGKLMIRGLPNWWLNGNT